MKIKTSTWTLLTAIIFSITTLYYYWKHSDDIIGIIIFSIATIIFYIATVGNWKSGN
jgi:hypothetical protein